MGINKKGERTKSYYNAAIKLVQNSLVELREIVHTDCPQTKFLVLVAIEDTNFLVKRLHMMRDASPN